MEEYSTLFFISLVGAAALIGAAIALPRLRLAAGVVLLVLGGAAVASVMMVWVGIPMMLIGAAFIVMEWHRWRQGRA